MVKELTHPKLTLTPVVQLAACLLSEKRYQDVENLVKKHVSSKEEVELRYYLALSHAMQGGLDEALKEIKVVLEKKPGYELAKNLAFKLLIQQASFKIKEKDWRGLSSVLSQALELSPDTPESRKELARFRNILPLSYIKSSNRGEAAQIWEEELKKSPINAGVIHNLALLYYWWALDEEKKDNNKEVPHATKSGDEKPDKKRFTARGGKLVKGNAHEDFSISNEANAINRLWEGAISYLITLVNIEQFWHEWKEERGAVYGIEVRDEDIKELRNKLIEDKLNKVLHDYLDLYKQNGNKGDVLRHNEYLATFHLERKSAISWKEVLGMWNNNFGIDISRGMRRYELVRAIQKAEGNSQCFGTVKDCNKISDCLWGQCCLTDRNREVFFNIPAGCLFFKNFNIHIEVHKLIELLHKAEPDSESLAKLRIYFHPSGLGRLLILAEEMKHFQQAIDEWKELPKDLINNSCIQDSAEGKYVYAFALNEKGKELSDKGKISDALTDWASARSCVTEVIENAKDRSLNRLFIPLRENIDESLISACKAEAKNLNKADKADEAIKILEQGLKIADDDSLREHLAGLYCERGYEKLKDEKLKDKRFSAARKDFEKALSIKPDYKRAKEGIGTSYNNEGVAQTNPYKKMSLLEKALEYDPDGSVVKENLARAYNGKAVDIIDSLDRYSSVSMVEEAISLFKKVVKLLNPSLEQSAIDAIEYAGDAIDSVTRNMEDSLYKTVLKNLAIAGNYRRSMRGW